MGMGVVIEYENRSGEPKWRAPAKAAWDYAAFARKAPAKTPDETISLTFEKVRGGRGGYNCWTINGKSWPDTNPLFTVREGRRYRLLLNNNSGDTHPVHMHRHTFEVSKVRDTAMSGLMKDTISLPRYSTAEIDNWRTILARPSSTAIIKITWTKVLPVSSLTNDPLHYMDSVAATS
jgi:hypothetical protein